MRTKRFTIFHSNDMHGDFLAEVKASEFPKGLDGERSRTIQNKGSLIGGLSLLSSYINKVRKEEEKLLS